MKTNLKKLLPAAVLSSLLVFGAPAAFAQVGTDTGTDTPGGAVEAGRAGLDRGGNVLFAAAVITLGAAGFWAIRKTSEGEAT